MTGQEIIREINNNIECAYTKLLMIKSIYNEGSLAHEWLEETASYLSTALELCGGDLEDYE